MEVGTMSVGVGDLPVPNINTHGGGSGGGGNSMSNMDMMNMDMGTGTGMDMGRMPMHDTFYWGKNAIVLFSGWPGDPNRKSGMYLLAIIFVFLLAFAVEILSVVQTRKSNAVTLTLVYVVRMVLVYMVMLAAMSFNMGIFIFIILGHALGFFLAKARSLVSADNSVQNLQGSPAPAPAIIDSKA